MNKQVISIIFSLVIFLVFCWGAIEAQSFRELARFFPFYICLLGAFVMMIDIIVRLIKMKKDKSNEPLHNNMFGVIKYTIIICSYLLLIYLVGIVIGTGVFLFTFLFYEAKLSVIKCGISVAVIVIGILIIGDVMNLYWPRSLLDNLIG